MNSTDSPAKTAENSRPHLIQMWRAWWRGLSPARQDRYAAVAPLVAVVLFFIAIVAAFWYLRTEELERERESMRRDVEYAQQRIRLRLSERQEQLMRLARDVGNQDIDKNGFNDRADTMISQYAELQALTWIDAKRQVRSTQFGPSVASEDLLTIDEVIKKPELVDLFDLARDLQQPVFSQPLATKDTSPMLLLEVPISQKGKFGGVLLAEFSIENVLRYATPIEILARYAVTLQDGKGTTLAGTPLAPRAAAQRLLPWRAIPNEYVMPVAPVGNSLKLKAQAYHTSLGMVSNGLFWLVGMLSFMTAWLLVATWRHTRKRIRAQEALQGETNFRRAMENSVLTGMRALDLQGRITYVNAAFCQMTGWSEQELVGKMPPYPYWPEGDQSTYHDMLIDEMSGKVFPGGFQMRVKRKNGTTFEARLYVSPLIDGHGRQTGWMTSMTDITEPNRIREQLSASYERFTIVLEALDASVSVAPLGSAELLFANKLYRQWFGSQTVGHLQLVAQAGALAINSTPSSMDDEDGLMGLPSDEITTASAGNAEIYIPELGKWLEVRSRYLNWVDGRLAQMVIATDITQRREAEEQSARQAERAASVSRLVTMGEMASSVAHELNQPLSAISNYCSGMVTRLKNGNLSEEALLGALEKTAHQAQRAGQVIHRIRSFVKRSEPNRELADASEIVSEAVELGSIELKRHNVRLSHHVAARLPQISVDSILIEQVLINLMKNGAESIANAKRPPHQRMVELRVVPRKIDNADVIEFSVQDTGHGLSPEVLDKLFQAFFSTKSEGMGIGLNLCRSIVESHHGRMQAENLYNGSEVTGCKFSFWIPVAPATDPAESPAR
ncbi:MAG: PAS domain S-box protein [Comamonas sp.]